MTVTPAQALSAIPPGLRDPLLEDYRLIIQNYQEGKWRPSELSGGRFCETVYTILEGHASGNYAAAPSKPNDFPTACRKLENNKNEPRSFQILIPRMMPALYEIRNNRNVGHVGGDVDPNHMDATAVVSMVNWIMAELVRVLHSLSTQEAQTLVDQLVERRIPVVWQIGDIKRVLNPKLTQRDQILLLVASCPAGCSMADLMQWMEAKNAPYFRQQLTLLHGNRYLEVSENLETIQLLPPGAKYVEEKLIPRPPSGQ